MAHLPSPPHRPRIDLSTLIARYATQPSRPRQSAPKRLPVVHRALDLQSASSLARAPRLDAPQAAVLCVTVATCDHCHVTHRLPGRHVLVRFDSNGLTNSLHASADELTRLYPDLPRETREFPISVPFCEECWSR